jgi:predicted metal-binding membrane protein
MRRPQFSIRILLWLTLIVAMILAPTAAVFRHFDRMIRESYRRAFDRLEAAEKEGHI